MKASIVCWKRKCNNRHILWTNKFIVAQLCAVATVACQSCLITGIHFHMSIGVSYLIYLFAVNVQPSSHRNEKQQPKTIENNTTVLMKKWRNDEMSKWKKNATQIANFIPVFFGNFEHIHYGFGIQSILQYVTIRANEQPNNRWFMKSMRPKAFGFRRIGPRFRHSKLLAVFRLLKNLYLISIYPSICRSTCSYIVQALQKLFTLRCDRLYAFRLVGQFT